MTDYNLTTFKLSEIINEIISYIGTQILNLYWYQERCCYFISNNENCNMSTDERRCIVFYLQAILPQQAGPLSHGAVWRYYMWTLSVSVRSLDRVLIHTLSLLFNLLLPPAINLQAPTKWNHFSLVLLATRPGLPVPLPTPWDPCCQCVKSWFMNMKWSQCPGSGCGHWRLMEHILELHTLSGFNCMHAFH